MNDTKAITICNQKGGVGKTTTAVNLGAALAQLGSRVLLIDLDSQQNLTSTLRRDAKNKNNINDLIYLEVKGDSYNPDAYICHNADENVDFIPASSMLSTAITILASDSNSQMVLSRVLEHPFFERYDYIIFDCKPTTDLLVINAMAASNGVIIPTDPSDYAVEGCLELYHIIGQMQRIYPKLKLLGVLITRADARRNITKMIENELRNHFQSLVFKTVIPELAEAANAAREQRSSVSTRNRIGNLYLEVAKEVMNNG